MKVSEIRKKLRLFSPDVEVGLFLKNDYGGEQIDEQLIDIKLMGHKVIFVYSVPFREDVHRED